MKLLHCVDLSEIFDNTVELFKKWEGVYMDVITNQCLL